MPLIIRPNPGSNPGRPMGFGATCGPAMVRNLLSRPTGSATNEPVAIPSLV